MNLIVTLPQVAELDTEHGELEDRRTALNNDVMRFKGARHWVHPALERGTQGHAAVCVHSASRLAAPSHGRPEGAAQQLPAPPARGDGRGALGGGQPAHLAGGGEAQGLVRG